MSDKILCCPFCGNHPEFPDAEDVIGTFYDAGCDDCGIATISLQIIDCFDRPRDHVYDSWDDEKHKYSNEIIEVVRTEAINMWNQRGD